MSATTRAIIVAVCFLFVLLSGYWLSRKGRPLHAGISAAHKLISLATGILLLVTIYQRSRLVPLDGTEWIAIVVTGVCFLALVVTGGLLSTEQLKPVVVLRVHQIVPILTLLSSAATMVLILGA
jgi:uncharacterized protein YneF (UPF0154 family)